MNVLRMDNRKTREREERAEDKSALGKSSQSREREKAEARKSCEEGTLPTPPVYAALFKKHIISR